MRFCPSCGLDTADVGDPYVMAPPGAPTAPPVEPVAPPGTTARNEPARAKAATALRSFAARSSRAPSVVIAALIVAVGLIVFGLLMRPQPSVPASVSGGQVAPGGSAAPALITGLTFESPADGQVIATKDVTVIGLAPPGLTVTRDVSFGLDQHATADGTGHWAINVGLNDGENKLKFRLGDDRSTERELRITYTPQAP
jgi:hypothetical protein